MRLAETHGAVVVVICPCPASGGPHVVDDAPSVGRRLRAGIRRPADVGRARAGFR